MDKTPLTIVVGIAYLSLTASAQMRGPDLSKYFNSTVLAGFPIPLDLKAPKVAEPRFLKVAEHDDQTIVALDALKAIPQFPYSILGVIIRELGFTEFNGNEFETEGRAFDKTDKSVRSFSTTNFHGKTHIILGHVNKTAYELRTYLVSSDGSLVAAVITTRVNGKPKVEKIANDSAQAGLKEQLEFWKDYYLTRIKVAKST